MRGWRGYTCLLSWAAPLHEKFFMAALIGVSGEIGLSVVFKLMDVLAAHALCNRTGAAS